MKKLLVATMFVLAALNLIDMGITTYLFAHFGVTVEMNTFMQALWIVSPILFIAFKVMLSVSFFFIAIHLKVIRKWMYITVIPTTTIYFGVVGWSVYVLACVL